MRRTPHSSGSLVDYGAFQLLLLARFHQPPFKPCLRFSRTRLNDSLLDVACVMSNVPPNPALHRVVMPAVTAFADSHGRRTHLARTDSRTAALSRLYRGVVGHCWHMPSRYRCADVTKAGSLPS